MRLFQPQVTLLGRGLSQRRSSLAAHYRPQTDETSRIRECRAGSRSMPRARLLYSASTAPLLLLHTLAQRARAFRLQSLLWLGRVPAQSQVLDIFLRPVQSLRLSFRPLRFQAQAIALTADNSIHGIHKNKCAPARHRAKPRQNPHTAGLCMHGGLGDLYKIYFAGRFLQVLVARLVAPFRSRIGMLTAPPKHSESYPHPRLFPNEFRCETSFLQGRIIA